MLEKKIESKAVDYAKKKGCWVRKFQSPGRRSAPDRIFAYEGSVWWIEFKAPKCEATKLQKSEHSDMRKFGLRVYVCDSFTSAAKVIDQEIARATL